MSRGNLILLAALAVAAGAWLLGRDWGHDKPTGPAPRLFRDFNRQAVNRIEISGGSGATWTIAGDGSDWSLESAGNYPVKRAEVDRFLDAVSNLRKDNPVGATAGMREQTRTDEKNGRLVRVLHDNEPEAEFYVGKNPKQGYREFFVRKADDDTVYRTQTQLTKERESPEDMPGSRASGFDWHMYTTEGLATKWVDPSIWDLGNAEVDQIWINRPGAYEAKIVRQAQDKWDLVEEGKEPVAADADVADGMLSLVRRLNLADVVGTYDDVAEEYGLHAPGTTIEMTLRKKKPEAKPGDGKEGEPKDGAEKKEEYVTFHRSIELGKKVSREEYDPYSEKMKTTDLYAIHVVLKDNENADEAKRAGFVFLVQDYTASQLRKDLADLKAKPKEEGKGPGEGEGEGGAKKPGEEAGEKPPDQKPADEKKPEEKPGDAKPAGEKPEGEKPAGEKPPQGEGKTGEGDGKGGCGEKEGCGEGSGDPKSGG